MKRIKWYILIFAVVMLVSGCQPNKLLENTPPVQTDEEWDPDTIVEGDVHIDNMDTMDFFDEVIDQCYAIVKAKYINKVKGVHPGDYRYNFERIDTIKGKMDEKNFSMTIFGNIEYDGVVSQEIRPINGELKKGNVYVVAIEKHQSYLFYEAGYEYYSHTVTIELDDESNITYVSSLFQYLDEEKYPFKNEAQLRAYIQSTAKTGMTEGFYQGEPFTDSEDLGEIVNMSMMIIEGKVREAGFQRDVEDLKHYYVEATKMLKAPEYLWKYENDLKTINNVDILSRKNSLTVGEDYLLILTFEELEWLPYPTSYLVASSNVNCSIIPLGDTERVNKVYELLGIQR